MIKGPRQTVKRGAGAADELIFTRGGELSGGDLEAAAEVERVREVDRQGWDGHESLVPGAVLARYGRPPIELPRPGVLHREHWLVESELRQGHHVSWSPAPESAQEGTPGYRITISTHPVGPSLTPHPTVLINRPSLYQYEPQVHGGGLIIYDSSLIDTTPTRGDVEAIAIPATDIADGRGGAQAANMVALALS